MSASNNAGVDAANTDRSPYRITTSGWYTFQHHFYNSGSGVLAVDMTVSARGSAAPLTTWTLTDPSDILGQTVGGNRYGWLLNNTQEIALDNITRSSVCTPTGFRNLTAEQIGGNVSGPLDATGCDIGVYYAPGTTGSVNGAEISGALYDGVVANAAAVNVTGSQIHNIGDTPLGGNQRGVGVYYTTLNPDLSSTGGTAATGTVSGNTFTKYQKGGIVVNGPGAAVTISGNTVTGDGRVTRNAQNGIQVGRGATGTITGNTVTGHAYTGINNADPPASS